MVFGNFLPCTDTQKSVTLRENPQNYLLRFFYVYTEIDNSEGPDVQRSSHPSMAKKKKKVRPHPINTYTWVRKLYADNLKMANRVYCTAASTRWYEKERKAVPTLLSPTSLTWNAIMSLEPWQAWVPLLNWGGWHSLAGCPWLTLLILFPKFWLGPESQMAPRASRDLKARFS